jgi:hypothetical protein
MTEPDPIAEAEAAAIQSVDQLRTMIAPIADKAGADVDAVTRLTLMSVEDPTAFEILQDETARKVEIRNRQVEKLRSAYRKMEATEPSTARQNWLTALRAMLKKFDETP